MPKLTPEEREEARNWLKSRQDEISNAANIAQETATSESDPGFWAKIQDKAGEILSPDTIPSPIAGAIAKQAGPMAAALDSPSGNVKPHPDKPQPDEQGRAPTAAEIAAASVPSLDSIPSPPAGPSSPGGGVSLPSVPVTSGGALGSLKGRAAEREESHKEMLGRVQKTGEVAKEIQSTVNELDQRDAQAKFEAQQTLARQAENAAAEEQQKLADREEVLSQRHAEREAAYEARNYKDSPEKIAEWKEMMESSDPDIAERGRKSLEKSQRLDPSEAFGSSAGQVFAYIAAALFGGKLPGVSQVVNMVVNNNLKAQRFAFAQKERGIERARERYDETVGHEDQLAESREQENLFVTRAIKEQLQERLGQTMSDRQRLSGEQALNEIQAQEDAYANKLGELDNQAADREANARAEMRFRLGQQRTQVGLAAQKHAAKQQGMQVEGLVPTGKTSIDETGFKKVREAKANTDKALAAIDRAIDVRTESGAEFFGSRKRELKGLEEEIATALSGISGTGVLNEGEYQRFKEQVGNLTGIGNKLDALKNLRTRFTRAMDSAYGAYGYKREDDVSHIKTFKRD